MSAETLIEPLSLRLDGSVKSGSSLERDGAGAEQEGEGMLSLEPPVDIPGKGGVITEAEISAQIERTGVVRAGEGAGGSREPPEGIRHL